MMKEFRLTKGYILRDICLRDLTFITGKIKPSDISSYLDKNLARSTRGVKPNV